MIDWELIRMLAMFVILLVVVFVTMALSDDW